MILAMSDGPKAKVHDTTLTQVNSKFSVKQGEAHPFNKPPNPDHFRAQVKEGRKGGQSPKIKQGGKTEVEGRKFYVLMV